jgi:pyruvate/oxaloacetate carboxyltransferase
MPTIYDPFRDPESGAKPMAMIQSEFEAAQDRPAPVVKVDEKAEKVRLEKATESVDKYNDAVAEAADRAAAQLEEKRNQDEEENVLQIVESPDKGDETSNTRTANRTATARPKAEQHPTATKS